MYGGGALIIRWVLLRQGPPRQPWTMSGSTICSAASPESAGSGPAPRRQRVASRFDVNAVLLQVRQHSPRSINRFRVCWTASAVRTSMNRRAATAWGQSPIRAMAARR